MTDRDRRDDITRYAAAVRSALRDLDAAERADLLDDLEAHLADVAAESGGALADRLGSPEAYAAELRAAYGARPRRRRLSRRWRLAYVAAFLVVAGLAWFSVAQTAGWFSSGDRWSYEQLVSQARAGHVRSLAISGSSATATDSGGSRHVVAVPAASEPLAAEMTRDGVEVDYNQSPGASYWASVVLPNVVLLLVIAALGVVLYAIGRRSPRRRVGWR